MAGVSEIIRANKDSILADWLDSQRQLSSIAAGGGTESRRREHSGQFLAVFSSAVQSDNLSDIHAPEWKPVLETVKTISAAYAAAGSSGAETATFVLSLKQPIFKVLVATLANEGHAVAEALWTVTSLVDKLGLYAIEVFQKTREDIIRRQQQELLELSTPVVKLVDELIALPLIGTLDSARTQVVMENLLQTIVNSNASIAILDITGVPTVDTQVAQHLLKTVAAARLMGADCIISGIRPQIAQTIVHLGVELHSVTTKATMADALKVALHRLGYSMVRRATA